MSPIALQVVLTLAAPALTALVGFVAYRHLRNAETDESKARTAKLIEEAGTRLPRLLKGRRPRGGSAQGC